MTLATFDSLIKGTRVFQWARNATGAAFGTVISLSPHGVFVRWDIGTSGAVWRSEYAGLERAEQPSLPDRLL